MTFNLLKTNRNFDLTEKYRNKRGNLLEDLFNNFSYPLLTSLEEEVREGIFLPKTNISENDSNYYLELEIPGVQEKDIEIKIDNNVLSVSGKSELIEENKERNYYVQERRIGSFYKSITLPNNINEDDIEASVKDGILKIIIPKKDKTLAKKIELKKGEK